MQHSSAEDAVAGVSGLLCCFIAIGLPVIILGVNVAILFWMAKDAKARGMDAAVWLIIVFLVGPIGLALYLFSRPQGQLLQCHNCGNNRMEASMKCPHCSAGQRRRGSRSREEDDDDDSEDGSPVTIEPLRPVYECPHCGARLGSPKQPLAAGQRYGCPICRRAIQL